MTNKPEEISFIPVKPFIYRVSGVPEKFTRWGWVRLSELDTVCVALDYDSWTINLLTAFVDLPTKKSNDCGLYIIAKRRGSYGIDVISPPDGFGKEQNRKWTKTDFEQPDGRCAINLHSLVLDLTFVPAGWALAVIEEVKKRKEGPKPGLNPLRGSA